MSKDATDKKTFERLYREDIRVAFDWEAFSHPAWTIDAVQLSLPRDIATVWTPWKLPQGRAATHSLGHTLSLREVVEDPSLIGEEQKTLFKHEAELVDGVRIDAPAFAISGGRYLILDHNHRIACVGLLHRTAVLDLFVIRGPDLSLIPDFATLVAE
jgi:hypothetical protein